MYRPLAYYAAYFTIRADGFDAATMILSNASIRDRLTGYAARDEKLNVKEKQEENALHMILEMQERGIRLLPADLYKSDKRPFFARGGATCAARSCRLTASPKPRRTGLWRCGARRF